jgi:hypothetical protein
VDSRGKLQRDVADLCPNQKSARFRSLLSRRRASLARPHYFYTSSGAALADEVRLRSDGHARAGVSTTTDEEAAI